MISKSLIRVYVYAIMLISKFRLQQKKFGRKLHKECTGTVYITTRIKVFGKGGSYLRYMYIYVDITMIRVI